jgi:hypothetical protein
MSYKGRILVDAATVGNGDSIAAYLADAAGTLLTSTLVSGKQSLDVNVTNLRGQYAEDTAHTTGDFGGLSLVVRRDANTSLVDTDGDYAPLQVNATGALKVAVSSFTSNYEYAEDTGHSTGAIGSFSLAVRQDVESALAGTTLDYIPFTTNAFGALRTTHKADATVLQQLVSVATSATALPAAALANRKSIMIQAKGTIYIGSGTVTATGATSGIELKNGDVMEAEYGPGVAVFGIAVSSAKDAIVLEAA